MKPNVKSQQNAHLPSGWEGKTMHPSITQSHLFLELRGIFGFNYAGVHAVIARIALWKRLETLMT